MTSTPGHSETLVSVIVPAYNAEEFIVECVTSVLDQTLDPSVLELLVVDDGSRDATRATVQRMVEEHPGRIRLLSQPNSGGAASPMNLGLDHARGRYVFFLGADDYLGPEALARVVEAAETNGADVVLGRMRGVGGRGAPESMFRRNEADADLFHSRVYWNLAATKLFRRSLVERARLRFPTDLRMGEDQPFVAAAYLNARRISVVADYDCYYAAYRPGNTHITTSATAEERLKLVERMTALVSGWVEPGPNRDLLMRRHFDVEVYDGLRSWARESDAGPNLEHFERFRDIVRAHINPTIQSKLNPMKRLQLHLLERGLMVELLDLIRFEASGRPHPIAVERVAWAPSLRGMLRIEGRVGVRGLPEDAFWLTFEASSVVGRRQRIRHSDGAFAASVPLASLPWGDWRVAVEIALGGQIWRLEVPSSGLSRAIFMRFPHVASARPLPGRGLLLRVSSVRPTAALLRRLKARLRGGSRLLSGR